MKAIMISKKPRECSNILNNIQKLIVTRNCPKCDLPIDVFIYCTKGNEILFGENSLFIENYINYFASKYYDENNEGDTTGELNGKVVAKFTLNKVGRIHNFIDGLEETELYDRHYTINDEDNLVKKSCLTNEELMVYGGEIVWHIDNLEIFDRPKELGEFKPVKWDKCGVKDKNGLYQCVKCPYGGDWLEGCKYKPLTKAPKNWGYVEK